jgi:FAD/FMN-containing dehydrogenase
MLNAETLQPLTASLCGTVITPSDPNYDSARKIYNAMIDKHPAFIVQCQDVADVINAVNFANEHHLEVSIRGGGHNGAGFSLVDDGLVIDLSRMNGTWVDQQARTVRAQGGCTWGDVDHATHPFGMATPSGILSTTGVGGLTLGGGTGNLTRSYGLTIDNLLEVDVVLANGQFVVANTTQNADLFWAVRGGGGNFGVVTSFLFKLHPVDTVYGGPIFWDLSDAKKVMRLWRDTILTAPETLNAYFALHTVPPAPLFPAEHHLKKAGVIVFCYTGDISQAEAVIRPFREIAKPIIDFAGPIPFPALQGLFDGLYPPGLQWYWSSDFFTELSEKAMDEHMNQFTKSPNVLSGVHIYSINGAAQRPDRHETAWSFREANFSHTIVGVDADPANKDKITKWSKDYFKALHPYSAGGAYLNMTMDDGQERVQAAYRDNYPRLAEIKKKYDPTNFFHVNQNIHPKG